MPLFNEQELRKKSRTITKSIQDSEKILLGESKETPIDKKFNIFLSNRSLDADVILGLRKEINDMGFSVYVDWIDDRDLDRTKVSKKTAERLRIRMKNSECLFFATSENSKDSKWMPWECGYFDGIDGKVAICPVAENSTDDSYKSQEYLELYPYIVKAKPKDSSDNKLWVSESPTKYVIFSDWLNGKVPTEHINF